jgi:hypothetical protein
MSEGNLLKPWSRQHEKCIECGSTEFRHIARGLCLQCYSKDTEKRNRGMKLRRREYGSASEKMTADYLADEYINKQKSLGDLAKECNCSRQMVYKKLIEFSIPLKTKGVARRLAHDREKIIFKRIDEQGNETQVVANTISVNEEFFSKWSPEMAYVLGVICTDGNLAMPHIKDDRYKNGAGSQVKRLSISQKEPEILEKVLKLMDCDAKLLFSSKKQYGGIVSGE